MPTKYLTHWQPPYAPRLLLLLLFRCYDILLTYSTALPAPPKSAKSPIAGRGYWNFYIMILALLALPTQSAADIVWKEQTLTGYTLNAQTPGLLGDTLVPVRAPLVQGCKLDINSLAARSSLRGAPQSNLAVVVVWQEAVAVGCFSFAQIHQLFVRAGSHGKGGIRGVIFGSAVDSRLRTFGSPLVEPYGDLEVHNSAVHVMLVADHTAKLLLDHVQPGTDTRRSTLSMLVDRSPWNVLFDSAGFAVQKYMFLMASASLVLYTLWKTVLVLCTPTAWNWRILMYIAAIGYLLVFTVLQPYDINNRVLQMAAYASWIVGYVVFTLFLVAWGSIVEKFHNEKSILRHHTIVNYSAAIIVSLSILVKLWAFAAESYQFLMIANLVVAYEVPPIFGLQTVLLGYMVWSFLCRTTIIAISRHTKKALHHVTVLCVVAIIGCTCILVMSVALASPARFSTIGYMVVIVLYKLGQCLILASIFAVLWVREHARQTRPQISEHEFFVEVEPSCIRPSKHVSHVDDFHASPVGWGLAHNDVAFTHGLAKSEDYPFGQRFFTSDSLARIASGDSITTGTHDACLAGIRVSHGFSQRNDMVIASITRKHSKRHAYVPLEPLSISQMQQCNSK